MGLLTRIVQHFSAEKINRHDNESAPYLAGNNLSSIFDSDSLQLPMVDSLELSNPAKYSINKTKLDPQQVKREHGITWFNDLVYGLVDKVRAQDIKSILERKYNLNANSTVDDYKSAARKYFQDMLGNVSNLSDEQKEKRYEKLEKEFYMQMTHLEGTDPTINGIISAIIGELKANGRVKAAEDMIGLSSNILERHTRARNLQADARYNMTNRDAFGNAPDNAMEYEHLVFANMDEKGIEESLKEIRDYAATMNIEECKQLKALKEQGVTLTREQEDLVLLYDNYLLASYAGGYTGISANEYIEHCFALAQMGNIYTATSEFGISNDVFATVYKFLQAHPEVENDIEAIWGRGALEVIDEATGGRYSTYIATRSGASAGGVLSYSGNRGPNSESPERTINTASVINDGVAIDKKNKAQKSKGEADSEENNKQQESENNVSEDTQRVISKYRRSKYNTAPIDEPIQPSSQVNTGNTEAAQRQQQDKPDTIEEALQGGITQYNEFRRENHIGDIESCITALNNKDTNPFIRKMEAKKLMHQNMSTKMFIYSCLNESAQIEIAELMSSEELSQINSFNGSDAEQFAKQRLEEERKKQDNNINNYIDISRIPAA